jgi:hypothetical protein
MMSSERASGLNALALFVRFADSLQPTLPSTTALTKKQVRDVWYAKKYVRAVPVSVIFKCGGESIPA